MQIEVRNGAFHYPNGKSVLESVNFSFDGRGVFAVLGPNGAGKTTLLSYTNAHPVAAALELRRVVLQRTRSPRVVNA